MDNITAFVPLIPVVVWKVLIGQLALCLITICPYKSAAESSPQQFSCLKHSTDEVLKYRRILSLFDTLIDSQLNVYVYFSMYLREFNITLF